MKITFGVGALVILSYTVTNLGKCILFFYHDSDRTIKFWSEIASCVSSIGFFTAFIALIMVFKNYAAMS